MGTHQWVLPSLQEQQLLTASPESSTARARQYFLECFWAKLLGFTKEEGGLVPASLQRAHLFPREVQQAFRSLFLGLHISARHHGQPFGKQQSPEEENLHP